MEKEVSIVEKVNRWIRNSVTLKLITVTILMLLLLIPTSMIESIIWEREELNNQAIAEVSSKWANNQQFHGPILTIPLTYGYRAKDGTISTLTKYWHILPENLSVNGIIEPEKLRRGMYEVVVYKSNLSLKGNFELTEVISDPNIVDVNYEKAFITIGITDLRGIEEQISFRWNNEAIEVEPGSRITNLIYSGVTVDLPNLRNLEKTSTSFDIDISIQGSKLMSFVPVGNTTTVNLTSSWPTPSFTGNFLPDERELSAKGFTANWKILQLNRNFPQYWIGDSNDEEMANASFGVHLLMPLDDYQKSMRSAKYAVMTIALTFLIFFLVEILNARKIHPFQYALVGLGLILFYVLLVSISEHSNFNFAFGVSALAIEVMIVLYSLSVFKSLRLSMILLATLTGIYAFLFVTLQLADYALLMGSIGLTIILGLTMYFTRNVNWYKMREPREE